MRCHHINVRAILKACGQFYTMKILKNEKTSKVIVAIAVILESISKCEIVCKNSKIRKMKKKRSKIFFVQNCPLAEKNCPHIDVMTKHFQYNQLSHT
jgi:hypothetical protein